jgi:hypothetical protein
LYGDRKGIGRGRLWDERIDTVSSVQVTKTDVFGVFSTALHNNIATQLARSGQKKVVSSNLAARICSCVSTVSSVQFRQVTKRDVAGIFCTAESRGSKGLV